MITIESMRQAAAQKKQEQQERERATSKAYREKNKEWIREQARELFQRRREYYREKGKRWHAENTDYVRERDRKKRYNITQEEWNTLFEEQNKCCAICHSTDPKSKRGWHTDHNHKTGKVRGILCLKCNHRLGHVEHELILETLKYITKHA